MNKTVRLFALTLFFLQFICPNPSFAAGTTDQNVDSVPTAGQPHPMPDAVGLTLSGGGAKGIAHIGVIQALEENGIPIDCITGTSMGAIVGGLYSMGYSPDEMMELIMSKPFQYWSTGRIDPDLTYYFLDDDPGPANINIAFGTDGSSSGPVLPSSLINPLPMNFAFVQLFAPYTAQCGGKFDNLMVPYRCVASDVNRKRKAIFSQGDLGDCIRASMSFPLVFHPIEIDGRPMYDGGIYDNFPVDVMLSEFNPKVMIGVDVSSGNTPDSPDSNMMDQLESLIMQYSDYSVPANRGMRLKMDLDRFGLLDFDKAPEIYRIGYDYAMSLMDSIKSRVHQRRDLSEVRARRLNFKAKTPKLIFDSVKVNGGSRRQNAYLQSLFDRQMTQDTLSVDEALDAYYRALTPGKLRNFMPRTRYDDSTHMFNLDLTASVKPPFNASLGGFLSTTTNSTLYFSAGYRTPSFNSLDLSVSGWLGQSYLAAEADARIQLLKSRPSSLGLQAVVSRLKYFPTDRFFFQTSDPTVLTREEYFGKLRYATALGRHAKAEIALGVGRIDQKFHSIPDFESMPRLEQTMGQLALKATYNTLDNRNYPTDGTYAQASLQGNVGKYHITQNGSTAVDRSWGRIDLSWLRYFPLGKHWSLGTRIEATATTDKILHSYFASLASSPAYVPTGSMANILTPSLRARQYAVAGVEPVWKISSIMQLRGRLDAFIPYRTLHEGPDGSALLGRPWHDPKLFAELRGVVKLSFASMSVYVHYTSATNHMASSSDRWNFGLTFGLYIPAPGFFN